MKERQPAPVVSLDFPSGAFHIDLSSCAPSPNILSPPDSTTHTHVLDLLREQQHRMQELLERFACIGQAFMQHHEELKQLASEHRILVRQAFDFSPTFHDPYVTSATTALETVDEDSPAVDGQGPVQKAKAPILHPGPASCELNAQHAQAAAFNSNELASGLWDEEEQMVVGNARQCKNRRRADNSKGSQHTAASRLESAESYLSMNSIATSMGTLHRAVNTTVRSVADMVGRPRGRITVVRDSGVFRQQHETRRVYKRMMESVSDSVTDLVSKQVTEIIEKAHRSHSRRQHTLMGRIGQCLRGTVCQSFISVIIMLQGLLIGVSTNSATRLAVLEWDDRSGHEVEAANQMIRILFYIDIGFTSVFAIELVARLTSERWLFYLGKEWKWNILDLFLVVSAVVEYLIVSISVIDISFFRLVRICRALRTLRIFRMFRMFSGLRLMVDAIFQSLLPLIWTSIFLGILIFIFAVLFQQAITNFLHGASPEADSDLVNQIRIFFENIP
eukprot:CAMPEP_0194546018 /NCGR_PEP_ID=MMETSP0253-20130528/90034_1 /TAXON_ID=2966 /ORGANISM="Noctiluca scintillans" /LENGTH=503 /DNA_ID=CAMNT_0039393067 /DNA_START=38 /DNA_END=1546 /DNA_ORIENTATION=+